jgi:cytochrome c biogenesis protein CcdA/thiol-disulfide isomerase/thioredoxin
VVTLIMVGFLAGVITSISPCILPVLPVILTSGTTDQTTETGARRRAVAVVGGLVLSFCLSVLFGSLVLSALHLPQDLLRNAGIAVLFLIGIGLIWPRFSDILERPFARFPGRTVSPARSGVVVGLGLGLLFVPCAGPVLAAIAVVGATHKIGIDALVLTAAFGVGVGVPLLLIALAGDQIARRTGMLRRNARAYRVTGGVVMIAVATLIAFNVTDGLQTHVPGYTTALQNKVEQNQAANGQLRHVTQHGVRSDTAGGAAAAATASAGATATAAGSDQCTEGNAALVNCGKAPDFTGITGWLNTPDGKPLSLQALQGKVVLVDFWTYSCINCQRTLPHVEGWYRQYAPDGLVVVGVHTPEFAFEHVTSNIKSQASALGVKYPIAIDNNYTTWNAYGNEYWPAEYLIDSTGVIRHVTFGEGDYSATEQLIRQLLTTADRSQTLPAPTDIPDETPTDVQTAETYLGSHYAPLHVTGGQPASGIEKTYRFPASLNKDTFALSGSWIAGTEELSAVQAAQLELSFDASDVYLVLGGDGDVTVRDGNIPAKTIHVSGAPTLYTLVSGPTAMRSVLTLDIGSGVHAYDFTFG